MNVINKITMAMNHINFEWNQFPKLKVNHITLNQDKTLLVVSTNSGFRIYEPETFVLLSEVRDYQELIGSLAKTMTLYNSHIIFFYATKGNYSFPSNQLIIWDDIKHSKLGLIVFKSPILNMFLTKRMIIVHAGNMIFILQLSTLTLTKQIYDISTDEGLVAVSSLNRTIAYIDGNSKNQGVLHINKFLIDCSKRISLQLRRDIKTNISSIGKIEISPKAEYLIAVSRYGNKIHIYSLSNYVLKYCFYLGKSIIEISSISFDSKMKFISIVCDYNELIVYDLKRNEGKYACLCYEHHDKDIKGKRKNSMISKMSLSKMFTDESDAYVHYLIDNSNGEYKVTAGFHSKKKKEMILAGYNGIVKQLLMNRKERGNMRVNKTFDLFPKDTE